jgi:hypothetical protein
MVQCKHCGNGIPAGSNFCPDCGKKLDRGLLAQVLIPTLWVIGIFLVVAVIAAISDTSSRRKDAEDSGPNLATGDHVVLSEDTVGCVSVEKLKALVHAMALKDKYGISALAESEDCVPIKTNTALLLLDFGWIDKTMLGETRVLSGEYAGNIIWVPEKDLQPAPQSAK